MMTTLGCCWHHCTTSNDATMPNYGIQSRQYLWIILLKNFKCTTMMIGGIITPPPMTPWCQNAMASGVMVSPAYFNKKFQVYDNDDNSGMLLAWLHHLQWCNNAKLQHPELSVSLDYLIKKFQVYNNDDNSGMSSALLYHLWWCDNELLWHLESSVSLDYLIKKIQVYNNDDNSGMLSASLHHLWQCDDAGVIGISGLFYKKMSWCQTTASRVISISGLFY